MGESSRPTIGQLRGLYLLVGECCELGADPLAWRRRMVEGLRKLLGAEVLLYTESEQVAPIGESRFLEPRLLVDTGWSCQSDRQVLLDFMGQGEIHEWDGNWSSTEYLLDPRPVLGIHRRTLVDDRTWYRGSFFNEWVRRSHNDHALISQYRKGNLVNWFTVLGAYRGPDFRPRHVRLLRLFAEEYVRLFGNRLAPLGGPSVADLPRRAREVLTCLMEGDSEKQIALRLDISPHTVHEHVRRLYRRFDVSSRAELLALCRRFWPTLAALDSRDQELGARTEVRFGKA